MPADYLEGNRAAWDRWSDGYQAKHGPLLAGDTAEAWGLWRQPESTLNVLGDVQGRTVLELGCGAAHWALALARRGANVVGLDMSAQQLKHAARSRAAAAAVELVLGAAERLPFASASFDTVFSDYGAMSWADPAVSVPEVARVLRPGGLLAFCTSTPFFYVCVDPDANTLDPTLRRPYFGMRRRVVAGIATDFNVGYGEWIRLLHRSGLCVEDLIEVQPDEHAFTTFADRPLEFARSWPVEHIWRARKRADRAS